MHTDSGQNLATVHETKMPLSDEWRHLANCGEVCCGCVGTRA